MASGLAIASIAVTDEVAWSLVPSAGLSELPGNPLRGWMVKSMGGESAEAWRAVLDDLIKRGLRRPEFLIVDGAAGLDKAIAAVWDSVPV